MSERSKEGVERPESDVQSAPLGGLKKPSSIMSACSNARLADDLWSIGLDKKLKTRKESISRQTIAPLTLGRQHRVNGDIPIDVMYGLVINS